MTLLDPLDEVELPLLTAEMKAEIKLDIGDDLAGRDGNTVWPFL